MNRREITMNDIEITERLDNDMYRIKFLCHPSVFFASNYPVNSTDAITAVLSVSIPEDAENFEGNVEGELQVSITNGADGYREFWYDLGDGEKRAFLAKVMGFETDRLRDLAKTLLLNITTPDAKETTREIGGNDVEVTLREGDNYDIKLLCNPADIFGVELPRVDLRVPLYKLPRTENLEFGIGKDIYVIVGGPPRDKVSNFWYELSEREKEAIIAKAVAYENERLRDLAKTLQMDITTPDAGETTSEDDLNTIERLTDDFCMEGCLLDTDCDVEVCDDCSVRKMMDYHRAKKGEAKC